MRSFSTLRVPITFGCMVVLVVAVSGSELLYVGDVPGGTEQSFCWGVNQFGTRAACTGVGPNGSEAFLWEYPGTITPLGDLPGGAIESRARDISRDGLTIVGSSTSAAFPLAGGGEPFKWTAQSGMNPIGLASGTSWGIANRTNSDGTATAIGCEMIGGPAQGFASFGTSNLVPMYALPTTSQLLGISPSGNSVCGWRNHSGAGAQAFRYNTSLGYADVPIPAGYASSQAIAMTEGTIVGSCTIGSTNMAMRGTVFGSETIGDLPGGAVSSFARDIVQSLGSEELIVGLSSANGYNVFVYSSITRMMGLDRVLRAQNVSLDGWSGFSTGNSIDLSPGLRGCVVGGTGTYQGHTAGFVARLLESLNTTFASTMSVTSGELFAGTLQSLEYRDSDHVTVLCDEGTPNGEIVFEGYCPVDSPNAVSLSTQSFSTRSDCSVFLDVYNFNTQSWTTVQTGIGAQQGLSFGTTQNVGSLLDPSTNNYRARIRWIPSSDLSTVDGWTYSLDYVRWNSSIL